MNCLQAPSVNEPGIFLVIAISYGVIRAVHSGFHIGSVAVRVHRLPAPKIFAYNKMFLNIFQGQARPKELQHPS